LSTCPCQHHCAATSCFGASLKLQLSPTACTTICGISAAHAGNATTFTLSTKAHCHKCLLATTMPVCSSQCIVPLLSGGWALIDGNAESAQETMVKDCQPAAVEGRHAVSTVHGAETPNSPVPQKVHVNCQLPWSLPGGVLFAKAVKYGCCIAYDMIICRSG